MHIALLLLALADAPTNVTPDAPLASGAPTPVLSATTPPEDSWTRHVTIGGGAILWYYQPFLQHSHNDVDLFFANILLDAHLGRFTFHAEPRIRNGRLRPFFAGPAWVQEVYGSASFGDGDTGVVVKAGKEYSHFGLFWDNSFYGNVQVYDGLKLDPDYGLSAEGQWGARRNWGLRAWGQFFIVDGQTNVSLAGRDTIGVADAQGNFTARRRNQAILRLEPFARLGQTELRLGLSASHLQADLPVVGKQGVTRGAADLTVTRGGLTLWGEVQRQNGQSVTSFPLPNLAAKHINYALAGGQYTLGLFTARYVFSLGDYRDVSVKETMHVPSLSVALDPGLAILAELVIWERHAAGLTSFIDRSLNVTLQGHF
jgi:hypothetical protein